MKKVSFRLISLVLALALCLLPTMAGAYHLDKDMLEFTVGVGSEQEFWYTSEPGDPKEIGHGISNCDVECGLSTAISFSKGKAIVYGTPTKAGNFSVRLEIIFKDGQGESKTVTLSIPIIIHAAQTPEPPAPTPPPTVPTVVDNVIYNAAPEHEQALIRGVKEWCNVRAGAGTNSAVIGRANLGQQISLLRWNADESWCFVEFNGLLGWIAKQFILPIQ